MNRSFLVMLTLLTLLFCSTAAEARMVHDFDCANCHKPSATLDSVTSIVCLDCHNSTMSGSTFPLYSSGPGNTNPIGDKVFAAGDASDALGSVTAQGGTPGDQTSHNWSAMDRNTKAGATAPSHYSFYGRQNYSGNRVTCARCHEPHGLLTDDYGPGTANPKLLKLGAGTELDMCNDCHVDWASDTAPSEGGSTPTNVHPMVTDYATVVTGRTEAYKSAAEVASSTGEVTLNNGGIDCLTCHGVHFTDSDSSTLDGVQGGGLGHLNPGGTSRGKILRANGSAFDEPNVAGESICQSCHKYEGHGNSQVIGCLICHSAHLEDIGGSMNNYMLRDTVTTYLPKDSATGTVSGLTLNIATAENTRLWNYCFTCHDAGTASIAHDPAWICSDCHGHEDTDGSWTAAGACNTCHGYPPSQAIASDRNGGNSGYAVQTDSTNYLDDSGHYKDESTTLHSLHAGGTVRYAFSCTSCHAGAGHIDKSYDDVFLAVDNRIYNGNGLTVAAYDRTGSGTCTNVYCHSNGGPRGNAPTVANPDVWAGGTVTGPNNCGLCHGNDVATMGSNNNSAVHLAHLNKGYSCQVCHSDTADSATALAAGAIGGTHIDASADVVFNATSLGFALGSTSYGTDGTCSVYCHSNGTTNVSPDWDTASTGACGTCHQVNASGDTGTSLSAAHDIHLYAAAGPQLYVNAGSPGCDNCHTNAGSGADHVNGSLDLTSNACDSCHGSDGVSSSGDDRVPVWTNANTVSCETCHSGSVIATINSAAPAKISFNAAGHGSYGEPCLTCHSSVADNNHLGALNNTDRLRVFGSPYNQANSQQFCGFCHGTGNKNHYANSNSVGSTNTSTDGNNCVICHDPHGQRDKNSAALDAMIRANINGQVVTGFTNRTVRTSYYATGGDLGEGICQTCHDPNEVSYFNRSTATTGHGGGGICVGCHPHTTTPAFQASCSGCHGSSATGQYWPTGVGGGIIPTANNEAGEHAVHILAIGQQLGYGDFNTTMYSDAQQKAICEYCHAGTANDSDHGLVGGLDADVFVDSDATRHAKSLWGANDTDAAYNNVADTCSNIDCHNSKLTVDDSYGWHDGASDPGCILCHNDITSTGIATGQTHAAHTGAATNYGITITCASCHDGATDWAGNTKPASNHIDGNFDMGGTVTLTYTAGSCGTNVCHENGAGGAPVANSYTWGVAEASACGICHAGSMTSAGHDDHLASSTYVTGCTDCHTPATAASHIDNDVDFDVAQVAYNSADGTCSTNVCHAPGVPASSGPDWRDSSPFPECTDCHSGTYIGGDNTGSGGNNYLPRYNMHDLDNRNLSGTVTSWKHADTFTCDWCHTAIMTRPTHLDGIWEADSTDNPGSQDRGIHDDFPVINFVDGSPPTCTTGCHTFGLLGDGSWSRKWSASAANSDGTECANCHGDFANGWVAGISARHSSDAELAAYHGGPSNPCMTCHTIGDGTGDYDWATQHRDGAIQLSNDMGWVDHGDTVGCSNCHSADDDADDSMSDGEHEMQDTYDSDGDAVDSLDAWDRVFQNGGGGSCSTCHVANGVDHSSTNENATVHADHVASGYVAGCTDCHSNAGPGNADHNNGTVNFNNTAISNADDYAIGSNFDGTCATNSCHDSDANEWGAGNLGGDSCTDCHAATGKLLDQGGYPPTSNEHAAHLDNDAIFPPASGGI